MGRMYTVPVSGVEVSAIQDFFEIKPPSDGCVIIHSIFIGQSSDAGDAEAEILPIIISRFSGALGSGGSTLTPQPHDAGDAAFGGIVTANNTAVAGDQTMLHSEVFNVQAGWMYAPTPEERIVLNPLASGVVVGLPTAPGDALTMAGRITFEEIG